MRKILWAVAVLVLLVGPVSANHLIDHFDFNLPLDSGELTYLAAPYTNSQTGVNDCIGHLGISNNSTGLRDVLVHHDRRDNW